LVWFVDDEDEEVSGLMDPDSLDPGSVGRVRSGRRSPRTLSPARRSPRTSSPARAASPAKQGKTFFVFFTSYIAFQNQVITCGHTALTVVDLQ